MSLKIRLSFETKDLGPMWNGKGIRKRSNLLRQNIWSPTPKPQPGEPGLRICDPRRQGDPALGTHFSRLLRHA
jgi:hypothetical protein